MSTKKPMFESSFDIVQGEPAGIESKSFSKRLLTAAIYAITNLVIVIIGMDFFVLPLAVSIVAGIGASEFYAIAGKKMDKSRKVSGILLAVALPLVTAAAREFTNQNPAVGQGGLGGFIGLFYAISIALGIYMTWSALSPSSHIKDSALSFFGALYLGIPLSFLLLIRDFENGLALTLGMLFSVWAADSFAYLFGSLFGRHKMAPKISPKKSWEGFIAGTIGSVIVWFVVPVFSEVNYPWYAAIIMGILLSFSALLGDLFESRLKREYDVKDSGDLLPGHGGILDRIDSQLSTSLFMFLFLSTAGTLLRFISS